MTPSLFKLSTYIECMLIKFLAQDTPESISGTKIFLGGMPPDLPRRRHLATLSTVATWPPFSISIPLPMTLNIFVLPLLDFSTQSCSYQNIRSKHQPQTKCRLRILWHSSQHQRVHLQISRFLCHSDNVVYCGK